MIEAPRDEAREYGVLVIKEPSFDGPNLDQMLLSWRIKIDLGRKGRLIYQAVNRTRRLKALETGSKGSGV